MRLFNRGKYARCLLFFTGAVNGCLMKQTTSEGGVVNAVVVVVVVVVVGVGVD